MSKQRWQIADGFSKMGWYEKDNAKDAWHKMYSEARTMRRMGRRGYATMTLVYEPDTTVKHNRWQYEVVLDPNQQEQDFEQFLRDNPGNEDSEANMPMEMVW